MWANYALSTSRKMHYSLLNFRLKVGKIEVEKFPRIKIFKTHYFVLFYALFYANLNLTSGTH